MVKILSAIAGDTGDVGLIPVLERLPKGGNGNSLQYSYLRTEEPARLESMVSQSRTRLSTHTQCLGWERRFRCEERGGSEC